MDLQTIIFIGRSGCGKGTQAERLKEHIGKYDTRSILHLQTGQRFRDFVKEDSYGSKLSKERNDTGDLQPSFLAVWAWGGRLARELNEDEHLILDGPPRRFIEYEVLDECLDFFKRKNMAVVYLNVSEEWSTERMKNRGREDDKDIKDIEKRLSWFEKEVLPIVEEFKKNDKYKFIEINGEQPIDDVHKNIAKELGI